MACILYVSTRNLIEFPRTTLPSPASTHCNPSNRARAKHTHWSIGATIQALAKLASQLYLHWCLRVVQSTQAELAVVPCGATPYSCSCAACARVRGHLRGYRRATYATYARQTLSLSTQ